MIKVLLNGKEVITEKGKTILDVAKEQGIKIPTLCHDEELKPFGSCWVCAVEVKGRRGFVTSCGTEVTDNMEITTDSEEIYRARKMALGLLLSDHFADCEAPCKIACPNHVDIQSYVALIANNQQHEAVKIIKDPLPLPLSIGRVCPAFCEEECRRSLVEEPVAIRQLKRYAADVDVEDCWSYVHPKEESKNKKVAIIGAGPSGLTCGYYLSNKGYDVIVYEASPEPGGWLRYGIPQYRLPKELLKKEIELMCSNGMSIETGKKLGKDFTLKELSNDYDAVYLALGAQKAVPMKVKGSELPGSFLGVDFLKDFMIGKEVNIGDKVAVVGGGNTAIDCARTAKRLGADVTIIYRRTRKEMPAEAYEVDAAEEEGIRFHLLTNPVEYKGDESGIKEVVLEKMKLGEPDASGRRRPEPTGEFFSESYNSVIAAISQVPDIDFLAEEENKIDGKILPLTRWSTAEVKEEELYTGLKNVFAGGDFRLGPATAIEAIADGRKASENIDKFLENGFFDQSLLEKPQFTSLKAKKVSELDKKLYEMYPCQDRIKMPEMEPDKRSGTFDEVELGFSEKQALDEAKRCLECGCKVNYRCDLRDQATEYGVDETLFFGERSEHPIDDSHPFIKRDANKCIKCGRCVRICTEVQGAGVLGYIYRGFSTTVAPEFGESLTKTACEACGKCITVCPVGALVEKNQTMKNYPYEDELITQNCGICGSGCKEDLHVANGRVSFITPAEDEGYNRRNLCFYGRFGWQVLNHPQRITQPMIKDKDSWKAIAWEEAAKIIRKKVEASDNKLFTVSPHTTTEEMLLMNKIAAKQNSELKSVSYKKLFTDEILAKFGILGTYSDLGLTDNIIIVGEISHTLRTVCRYYQRQGKKLVLFSNDDSKFNDFADKLFKEEDIVVADLELTGKTLFVYNRNKIIEVTIKKVWELALKTVDFSTGSGILETSDWHNMNGFRTLQVNELDNNSADKSFRLLYGERGEESADNSFTVVVDTHWDQELIADLLLPRPAFLEMLGSALNDSGEKTSFLNPQKSNHFDRLLHLFHDAGLIEATHLEPSLWNNLAEKQVSVLTKPDQIDKSGIAEALTAEKELKKEAIHANTTQWKWLNELKETTREQG